MLTIEQPSITMLMKKTILLFSALLFLVQTNAQQDSLQSLQAGIVSFNAKLINQNVQLVWTVGTNEEIKSFEVERLEKDSVFKKIGGRLPLASAGTSRYEFVDAMVRNTGFFYRVKAIRKDGTIYTSELLFPKGADGPTFKLKQNPVRNSVDFEVTCTEAVTVASTIYTVDGVKLATQTTSLPAQASLLSISSQSLKAGVYRLALDTGKERKVFSFVKE